MNRRKFALSWGRKIFFGISWPLTIVLTLLYLRSFILPSTATDWIYYVTTLIGHTGLITSLFYFLLFCPVILLFPSYYMTKIWALILIIVLNLFVFVDALSYSSYHLHIYSFLHKLFLEEGIHHLFGSSVGLMILGVVSFILAIIIWIRGEMVWRSMQGRFSNPVKNWYLIFVVFCLIVSKSVFYYADIHTNLAENFTLNLNLNRNERSFHENRKFFYPKADIQCTGKQNPNVVMIVLNEWSQDQLNPDSMPLTFHMKKHAISYLGHRNVASTSDGGLFAMMYSLPASYLKMSEDAHPALMTEFAKRKYELVHFLIDSSEKDAARRDEATMLQFRDWVANRSGEEINGHYILMTLDQHSSLTDKYIQEVVLELQKENLLKNSYIIVTGKYSSDQSQSIPLLWVSPDRRVEEISHTTTHYDLAPTLMTKAWACKNAFTATGPGVSLEKGERDWFVATTEKGFRIVDVERDGEILVEDGIVSGTGRRELVFQALKLLTKFNRPN